MDKYEYTLRLDQMKSRFAEEKYEEAAEIADTINWNKVKNVNGLVKAGEVYEKVQRYEDSRDVLLMAYDRSPIGRMIIYRLAEVSIKMEDFQAAQDYYDEFVEIAPHDTLKYVLRYDIKKAQGAPYSDLISILEELKDQEYTEEWAYELAYLYHKAGMSEKCIDACDELILWFGDGPYVERALELKMLYQPLTKAQEEKYRSFRKEREDRNGLTHIDAEEMVRAGEYVHDPVAIPKVEVNPERYNTVNLQAEIAKGMQQIIEATEKETVTDTMDNINRMVEDIPYLKIPKEEEKRPDAETPHIETDEEIDGSLKMNFQEMLGEESDGQMSLVMNDKSMVEHQITGQITIEEVLEEWEKTRRAAEAALEDAKQRKLESAKARALQEAGTIMDRLTGVLPKLDAGVTPRELLEEEYMQDNSETEAPIEPNAPEMGQLKRQSEENGQDFQPEAVEPAAGELEEPEPSEEEELWPEGMSLEEMVAAQQARAKEAKEAAEGIEGEDDSVCDNSEQMEETEPSEEEIGGQEPEQETSHEVEEEKNDIDEDRGAVEMETELIPETITEAAPEAEVQPKQKKGFEEVSMDELPERPTLEQEKEEEFAFVRKKSSRPSWKEKTTRMPQFDTPVDLGREEKVELTDEQKAIFSYFMPVKGMEEQLCHALSVASYHLKHDHTASMGNLVIQGGQGSGKTTLATSVIKVLQQETGMLTGKIGKIHAEALNKKNVANLFEKVAGGCLIIEQAGEMDTQTISELSLSMAADSSGVFVILEDTSKGIRKLFEKNKDFSKKFSEQITVPIFTNDELVTFARSYARELGYKIDDLAVLALYNRISNIQRLDQATTLAEVKDIVDEAIDREAHGGLKKAISILTASRYTDDDRIVLREKDFE